MKIAVFLIIPSFAVLCLHNLSVRITRSDQNGMILSIGMFEYTLIDMRVADLMKNNSVSTQKIANIIKNSKIATAIRLKKLRVCGKIGVENDACATALTIAAIQRLIFDTAAMLFGVKCDDIAVKFMPEYTSSVLFFDVNAIISISVPVALVCVVRAMMASAVNA